MTIRERAANRRATIFIVIRVLRGTPTSESRSYGEAERDGVFSHAFRRVFHDGDPNARAIPRGVHAIDSKIHPGRHAEIPLPRAHLEQRSYPRTSSSSPRRTPRVSVPARPAGSPSVCRRTRRSPRFRSTRLWSNRVGFEPGGGTRAPRPIDRRRADRRVHVLPPRRARRQRARRHRFGRITRFFASDAAFPRVFT